MRHIFLIPKNTIKAVFLVILILACASAILKPAELIHNVSAAIKKENPIYFVYTDENKISLSFDAAWGCEHTEDILNILADNNIKATFFLTNIWLKDYPEMAKKIADNGHEIAMHSTTHPHMNSLSKEQIIKELEDNKALIEATTSYQPILFRMPFGEYNNLVINTVKELGYYPIQWSIDSLDWQDTATAQSITERVTAKLHSGAIILMHNNGTYTSAALVEIISFAQSAGYEFVPIGELIYAEPYSVDTQGGQSDR